MNPNIRGLRFEIPNEHGQALKNILEVISEEFIWNVIHDEIYITGDRTEKSIFSTYKNIAGKTFKKIINIPSYYTIFCNLQGSYFNDLKVIEIYETFLYSDCEIVVLIVDNVYVDIYVKNIEILEKLEENAIKNEFKKITHITKTNDRFEKFTY